MSALGFDQLADEVRAHRSAKGWSQAELAQRAGVASSTIQNLEGRMVFTRLPNKIGQIERALGWGPGTAKRVVYGGEPVIHQAAPPLGGCPDCERLAALLAEALRCWRGEEAA